MKFSSEIQRSWNLKEVCELRGPFWKGLLIKRSYMVGEKLKNEYSCYNGEDAEIVLAHLQVLLRTIPPVSRTVLYRYLHLKL